MSHHDLCEVVRLGLSLETSDYFASKMLPPKVRIIQTENIIQVDRQLSRKSSNLSVTYFILFAFRDRTASPCLEEITSFRLYCQALGAWTLSLATKMVIRMHQGGLQSTSSLCFNISKLWVFYTYILQPSLLLAFLKTAKMSVFSK